MGVTCLWLMPFFPSRKRDDGYDITDFYGVDPRLGTLGDFTELVRTARDRGIRVIADLVVNHTSDRAPLVPGGALRATRRYRDFYVWGDEKPEEKPGRPRLPGQGEHQLGVRRPGRAMLPAPLLRPPARPQPR